MRQLFRHLSPATKALLPFTVELAIAGALIYGLAALFLAACSVDLEASLDRKDTKAILAPLKVEHTEVTCAIASDVLHELGFEMELIVERITDLNDDTDPSLYVLGAELQALLTMEANLKKWQGENSCGIA